MVRTKHFRIISLMGGGKRGSLDHSFLQMKGLENIPSKA